jgi:hypothetical protein
MAWAEPTISNGTPTVALVGSGALNSHAPFGAGTPACTCDVNITVKK